MKQQINTVLCGDIREVAKVLPSGSVNCIMTSPPYFGLRDYGTAKWEGGDGECDHRTGNQVGQSNTGQKESSYVNGVRPGMDHATCARCGATRIDKQMGLEETPEAYVANLVGVFRELKRVLRDDGVLWLVLGDSYNTTPPGNKGFHYGNGRAAQGTLETGHKGLVTSLKPKNLIGIPWRVAFALQADGWYLRSDVIWAKSNPMPESVTDRPTKSHEYVFLLTKKARYWYDADAIKEQNAWPDHNRFGNKNAAARRVKELTGNMKPDAPEHTDRNGRNARTVWTIPTVPLKAAHFAAFPPVLVEKCILAGCPSRVCVECGEPWVRVVERKASTPGQDIGYNTGTKTRNDGDRAGHWVDMTTKLLHFAPTCQCNAPHRPGVVLDPFIGSGTVAQVAIQTGRDWLGVELNPEYIKLARARINGVQPALFPHD